MNKATGSKVKKIVFIAVYTVVFAVFAVSVYKVAKSGADSKESDRAYGEMSARFAEYTEKYAASRKGERAAVDDGTSAEIEYVKALCEGNDSIRGWIRIDDSPVDYPVLQGMNNSEYVSRLADGSYNIFGSIFLDCRNSKDFSDRHNIIYGHNTTKGSMFGSLKEYKDKAYFDSHPSFVIYTPDCVLTCSIFAVRRTDAYGDDYDTELGSDDEVAAYVAKAMDGSFYDTGVDVEPGDSIITLSTCERMYRARERITIHAKVATNCESVGE